MRRVVRGHKTGAMAIDNHLFELLEPDEAIELIAHTRTHRIVVTNLGLAIADDERVAWHIPYAALRRIEFDIEHDRPATLVIMPGTGHFAPIVDHDLADWQRLVDLCLTGVFLTVKHAGRAMSAGGGGSIVTMASLNAVQPAGGMSAYCSSKAAVAMLSQVAALELGPAGIRVNAIGPGLVQTGLTAPLWSVPGIVDAFVDNTAIGRFAQPEDVADLALFLASDESSFVTGSLYLVDGGAHALRYPDLLASLASPATGS